MPTATDARSSAHTDTDSGTDTNTDADIYRIDNASANVNTSTHANMGTVWYTAQYGTALHGTAGHLTVQLGSMVQYSTVFIARRSTVLYTVVHSSTQ